ncbi:MAG TPA: Rrf2 family transcriptional regulator [Lachnospiraceae bacterium]|nr:Rrf2 family transcriptional regulator [Lachnospiraceae bacterium]
MKITTRGRYALNLMLDMVTNSNGSPIKLRDIAERQKISDKYLEQIVAALNKAGLIRSIRGSQGGYLLVRKPEEYTVGEILRITEGNMAPVPCLEYEENQCNKQESCVSVILYKKINDAINSVIDTVTLADMYEWQDGIHSDKLQGDTVDSAPNENFKRTGCFEGTDGS